MLGGYAPHHAQPVLAAARGKSVGQHPWIAHVARQRIGAAHRKIGREIVDGKRIAARVELGLAVAAARGQIGGERVDASSRQREHVLHSEAACLPFTAHRARVGDRRKPRRRPIEAVRVVHSHTQPVALAHRMVHARNQSVGAIHLRRHDKQVVAEERTGIGIRRRIQVQRGAGLRIQARLRNPVAGKREPVVLKVLGSHRLSRAEVGIRTRRGRVVDRQRLPGRVHRGGPVSQALWHRRDGTKERARDLLPHAFKRDAEEGGAPALV